MSTSHESEGFVSTPLEGQGARRKDNYYPDSEENEVRFREADDEYQRLKEDFVRIAQNRRTRHHSRSDSSKRPSPRRRQPPRRSTNLPKFKIATFYATDVELWFNQIETHFDLHQIHDDDERYSLTCAALSGEVASDVRDVLLQPFRSHKYKSLKSILIERNVEESKPGVAEIKVDKTTKLVGLLEDLSKRLKKLETATAADKRRNQGRGRANNHYAPRPTFIPNAQATEFVPNKPGSYNNAQKNTCPYVPPQNAQQNNAANRIDTANAPVCYFHQTFGDKARTCRSPCAFSLTC